MCARFSVSKNLWVFVVYSTCVTSFNLCLCVNLCVCVCVCRCVQDCRCVLVCVSFPCVRSSVYMFVSSYSCRCFYVWFTFLVYSFTLTFALHVSVAFLLVLGTRRQEEDREQLHAFMRGIRQSCAQLSYEDI